MSEALLETFPALSVPRTYIVCEPSVKFEPAVQDKLSLVSSKLPSEAVHVVHKPLVESIWYWTLEMISNVSLMLPVMVGVVSAVGSGERAVKDTVGEPVSTTKVSEA